MALKIMADSWSILEWLKDSPKAGKAMGHLKQADEILSTPLLVSEIYYRICEYGGDKASGLEALRFVQNQVRICEISIEIAIEAGNIHLDEKLPLVDAFTLAVARKEGAKILTGDPHFKKCKEAIYIGD